jgi:hypothetical protein
MTQQTINGPALGLLRVPQHERKNTNDINSPPFVTSINSVQALSAVEGLLGIFLAVR